MRYEDSQVRGGRLTSIAVVVGLHVIVAYALVNGLARKIVEVVQRPLETTIIEEVKAPPPPPPPPTPPTPKRLAAPPPPFIPPPEIQIQQPQTPPPAITAVTSVKPAEPVTGFVQAPSDPAPPAPAAPPREPTRTAAVVDAKACQKPNYPRESLRAEESGVVLLAFLVDVDGSVVESRVDRSTGYRRLDEAARRALSLCKFRPATVDGKPERSWARLEYEWKIE